MRLLLRSKAFVVGTLIVAFWVFCAIFGATIAPYDPLGQSAVILHGPSTSHLLGTDSLGRDVLSRVLAGARDILIVAPVAMLVGLTGGTIIGLVTAYYRGWVDDVIGRIIDTVLAIPVVIIAVTALVALGGSRPTIMAWALLHRYSHLRWYMERLPVRPEARDLETLARDWFTP